MELVGLSFPKQMVPRRSSFAAVATLGAAGQYEVAVIVAGDGDYVPLIEAVKRLRLHVAVAFVDSGLSPELRIAADEFVDLTQPLVTAWREWREYQERPKSKAPSARATQ